LFLSVSHLGGGEGRLEGEKKEECSGERHEKGVLPRGGGTAFGKRA